MKAIMLMPTLSVILQLLTVSSQLVTYHSGLIKIKSNIGNVMHCLTVDMSLRSVARAGPKGKRNRNARLDKSRKFVFKPCASQLDEDILWDISGGQVKQTVFRGFPGERVICISKYPQHDYLRAVACDNTAIAYNITSQELSIPSAPHKCLRVVSKKLTVAPTCRHASIDPIPLCDPPVIPICDEGYVTNTTVSGCPSYKCICDPIIQLDCGSGKIQKFNKDSNNCTIIECECPTLDKPDCGNNTLVPFTVNTCEQYLCLDNDSPCDNLNVTTCTAPKVAVDGINGDGCSISVCECPDLSINTITCESGLVVETNTTLECPFLECTCPEAVIPDCPVDGTIEDYTHTIGSLNCTLSLCNVNRCDDAIVPTCSGNQTVTGIVVNGCPEFVCQCPEYTINSCNPGESFNVVTSFDCDILECTCPPIQPDQNCTGTNVELDINGCKQYACIIDETCPPSPPSTCPNTGAISEISVDIVDIFGCPSTACQCPVLVEPSCTTGLVIDHRAVGNCAELHCVCPPLEEPACTNGTISSVADSNGCLTFTCTLDLICTTPTTPTCSAGAITKDTVTNGCHDITCVCPDLQQPTCTSGLDQYGCVGTGCSTTLECQCPTLKEPTCTNGTLSEYLVDNCNQYKCTKDLVCSAVITPTCTNPAHIIIETVIDGCPEEICVCPDLIPPSTPCDADQLLTINNSGNCPVLECSCPVLLVPDCTNGTLSLVVTVDSNNSTNIGNCLHYKCVIDNPCSSVTPASCSAPKVALDVVVNDCPAQICVCPDVQEISCVTGKDPFLSSNGGCDELVCDCPVLPVPTCNNGNVVSTFVNGCETFDCEIDLSINCVVNTNQGWSQVGNTNVYFKFFANANKNWRQAKHHCKSLQSNADLASIRSQAEQNKLEALGNAAGGVKNCWLNAMCGHVSMDFYWLDGHGAVRAPGNYQNLDTSSFGVSNLANNNYPGDACFNADDPPGNGPNGSRPWRNRNCNKLQDFMCQIRCG